MSLQQRMTALLRSMGSGYMSPSAYDTAWLARLGEMEPEMSSRALAWLRDNQLPDGSWGTPEFEYAHDRLICTLAAMIALTHHGENGDAQRVAHAHETLQGWIEALPDDDAGETIGFEMIIPTLLDDGKDLGIINVNDGSILYTLAAQRTRKVTSLPSYMINRNVTVAFSSEMVGLDAQILLDKANLQEANGSIAYSPAATAFYALYVNKGNRAAMDYLHSISKDGSAPNNGPIDVFEVAWVLWNLALTGPLDEATLALCQPHLDFLESAWMPGWGAAACRGFSLVDGDDSSVVFKVLTAFGRKSDLNAIQRYEVDNHYLCFPYESNPSISTNIHILGALKAAGLPTENASVQKVLEFLRATRIEDRYWYDKWHVSPYYPTVHAIINSMDYAPELAVPAIEWLLETQNEDGSWGYYVPTAEETAYCLQALLGWKRARRRLNGKAGVPIQADVLLRAEGWLREHMEDAYPMLWIGKSLYSPDRVIEGTILSTLIMAEQEREGETMHEHTAG